MIQYRKPNVKEDEIKATERQQVLLYNYIVLYCVYMYLEIISDSFPANLAFRKNYLELVF